MKPQLLISSILILQLSTPFFAQAQAQTQEGLGQSEWQTPGSQSDTGAGAQSDPVAGTQPQFEQSNQSQQYSSGNESTAPAQLGQSEWQTPQQAAAGTGPDSYD